MLAHTTGGFRITGGIRCSLRPLFWMEVVVLAISDLDCPMWAKRGQVWIVEATKSSTIQASALCFRLSTKVTP